MYLPFWGNNLSVSVIWLNLSKAQKPFKRLEHNLGTFIIIFCSEYTCLSGNALIGEMTTFGRLSSTDSKRFLCSTFSATLAGVSSTEKEYFFGWNVHVKIAMYRE